MFGTLCSSLNYIPKTKSKSKRIQPKRNGPSYNISRPNTSENKYCLGEIWLGTTKTLLPEDWTTCRAELASKDDVDKLFLHFDTCIVISTVTTDYQFLKDLLSTRLFSIEFKIADDENLLGCLYFSKLPLPKLTNKLRSVCKTVFSLTLNRSCEYNEINTIESSCMIEHYNDLYKNVSALREDVPSVNVFHLQLKPELRPYQQNAVRWMLQREKCVEYSEKLHPLYEKVTLSSGVELYYDKYTGHIELTEPIVEYSEGGGILADEMGLGKTVEILALILLNRRPELEACDRPKIIEINDKMETESEETHKHSKESLDNSTELNAKIDVKPDDLQLEKTEIRSNSIQLTESSDSAIEIKETVDTNPENLQIEKTETPTVEVLTRKRKIRRSKNQSDDSYVIKEKKVKVTAKKSTLRVALETWYDNMLAPKDYGSDETGVRCICGETDDEDTVECSECQKIQHASCLGYKKNYGLYLCPQCWMDKPLIESGATLIVTPTFLKQQWCEEICKHVSGKFRVLQYGSGQAIKNVYPAELLEYDIVITTYNILQSELRLSENGQSVSLRRPPKYSLPGSPITLVKWWRLCLDEAQTVETPGNMVSVMAKKLCAHHRWAVTGTPISKDISDLYGLIDYLQMSPYCELEIWDNLFYKPYINGRKEAMHKFLSQILWRTAKNDVLDQINIPRQTVQEYWVEFRPVEKFFYDREHELSSHEFLYKLRNIQMDVPMKLLNKSILKKIMTPLLALRQACVHHQTVKGRYLATCKQVSSMEDLLDALIAKSLSQCEEHIRSIVSAMNGLASVYLLQQNPPAAAEVYRKVLALADQYSSKNPDITMEIDKLQLIHTLYNLVEILDLYPAIPHTAEDDGLKERWRHLETEYLGRIMKQLMSVMTDNEKLTVEIEELQKKFVLPAGQWFADMLDWITTNDHFRDYINKLATLAANASVVYDPCLGERSTLYKIANWDEKIGALKVKTISAIDELLEFDEERESYTIPMSIINEASKCHLRQEKNSKKKKSLGVSCRICVASNCLNEYESVLFSSQQKQDMALNAGSWKPAAEEFMVKALYNTGKTNKAPKDLLHDGERHLEILELIRKEFKEIRKLWTFIDSVVCAYDELDMCKIRLQIREPENNEDENASNTHQNRAIKALTAETTNRLADIYYMQAAEIPYQLAHLSSQERAGLKMLEANVGTYKYLQTLHKQQTKGEDPDPCPICKCVLDKQWNILTCGHCYCIECVQVLIGQQSSITKRKSINCAICRKVIRVSEISYIHKDDKPVREGEQEIMGNCSSKVEAVVRLVLDLKKSDPDVKVLVFSNWPALLKLMHPIFEKNNITTEVLLSSKFDKSFKNFKDMVNGITALLLPVNLGSKGLNIIEATHVIFVEPLLNPGDELQAIGRVHRIGQTKPTVVHKFFMKNTIEESIYHTMSTNAEKWDANKVTLGQIKELFDYANFNGATLEDISQSEVSLGTDNLTDSEENTSSTNVEDISQDLQ